VGGRGRRAGGQVKLVGDPAATNEAGEPTAKRERGSARSTALVGPTSQPVAADWFFFYKAVEAIYVIIAVWRILR